MKKKLSPKKLDQLILMIEEHGLDWNISRYTKEGLSTYRASVSPPIASKVTEPKPTFSRGEWKTPVEALADAYARYKASRFMPIVEQMGLP
ncbi:hypothetical protein [Nostoc sp. PA-18-2419]|uniref:hypothetical protein n=1 Tax=Nostoc sp. PA-18-2419 TaxID=2575443 RepID=UPI0011093986|nr:hypothetical protein [Nostoc sp. PA-18-2419]